jgi:uncharacterized membrane protein HdeD (DUF308 family)
MKNRTDKTLLILIALFVGALALVAGAISFSHMREQRASAGDWTSYAAEISRRNNI